MKHLAEPISEAQLEGYAMTEPTTADVLNRAADLIEEKGWGTGAETWHPDATEGLCIEGALAAVLGVELGALTTVVNTCAAGVAVREYLALEAYGIGQYRRDRAREGLWWWNDADGRTASEVIEVLRATALIAAAREREPAEATS